MHLIRRNTCRVCGSAALTPVIDLGKQCLQGSFIKAGKQAPSVRKLPTSLVLCNPDLDEKACGLLQTEYTVPPEVLYSVYWYRSGTNATMRDHLRGVAEEAAEMIGGKKTAMVLDIGCNDGTLLGSFPSDFIKYGIDPCDIAKEVKPPISVVQDFFPSAKLNSRIRGRKFDIVTSIAMFYDLEDPVAFARAVKAVLSRSGIWIFEMSYMPTMLKNNSYDTICHEHIEYYSLTVIEHILKKAGMKLIRISLNDINGGSLRCAATHGESSVYKKRQALADIMLRRQIEFVAELATERPYRRFQGRIDRHGVELISLLKRLKKEGKKIHVYGASTKGNTILQWCGIDWKIIDCAADRNPEKYGARTLGTNIPIVSEAESRAMGPDYYLVLPWHFKEEFLGREREALERGVGFIFPLPKIEIIRGPARAR